MNWERRWLLGVALLLLSGASAPALAQVPPPAAAAVDTVRLAPASPAESLFAPLPDRGERWSLARCIQTALERNADVRVAAARTKQASGSALSGWSGIIPSVQAGASYVYSVPDKNASFTSAEFGDSTVFGFSSKDEFGSITASATSNIISAPEIGEKQRRDHLHASSEQDEAETRNQVVFRVKRQYFQYLKAERLAQVARETEKLARDEETRARALMEVGTVARGDLLKASARRATTQADRITAENQVEIQASRLRQVLGINPAQPIAPEPILDEAILLPDSAAMIRQAVTTRPLLESAKAIERAAHSGLFSAKAERLPRITGSLDFRRSRFKQNLEDIQGPGPLPDEIDVERYATEWQGAVQATLPLFEGLAIEGGVRQAKGSLLEAESQRRQRELDVAVETQQAWLLLREAIERIAVAREGLASAEEDYKFSKGRYDLGAGTYLDLLTAQVGLANARQRLVESVADAKVAEAGLEAAVGAKRY